MKEVWQLKYRDNLDVVELHTRAIKYRGGLKHAVKYALWALRPEGTLEVVDNGPQRTGISEFQVTFNQVRQLCLKAVGEEGVLEELDSDHMYLRFRRTSLRMHDTWSAGVVFSGRADEMPQLNGCLDGLLGQPELRRENGEILVCGPADARHMLAGRREIRYLEWDGPRGKRFLICEKKNALARKMRGTKCVILHSRIVLDKDCLAALPREFDLVGPSVSWQDATGRLWPYLDFLVTDASDPSRFGRRMGTPVDYDRMHYWRLLRRGVPYVDGGVFMARREMLLCHPLNDKLAWGELEDVEWCARLHHAGFLIDYAPRARARSQTLKIPRRPVRPRSLVRVVRRLWHLGKWTRAALRHYLLATAGRR